MARKTDPALAALDAIAADAGKTIAHQLHQPEDGRERWGAYESEILARIAQVAADAAARIRAATKG